MLFRFGRPQFGVGDGEVLCRYGIEGGLLALRAGGWVAFAATAERRGVRVERHCRRLSAETCSARRVSAVGWHPLREGPAAIPCGREPALLRATRRRASAVTVAVFGALEGADVVYYLVHSLGARDFEQQDRRAAANVSRGAARAGVKQIVYLGGLGGDDPSTSAHLRSRRETGERLAADGVPVTTLRAAIVIGEGSAAFETILGLVKRLPVMITPSWVSTPTQPIAARRRRALSGGRRGKRRRHRPDLRCRRTRGDDLPADDRAVGKLRGSVAIWDRDPRTTGYPIMHLLRLESHPGLPWSVTSVRGGGSRLEGLPRAPRVEGDDGATNLEVRVPIRDDRNDL